MSVWIGDQYRDKTREYGRSWAKLPGTALHTTPLPASGPGPRGHHRYCQRHFPGPLAPHLGRRNHDLRLGLDAIWGLGPEPDDRMASTLWGQRRDDLLARRKTRDLHLLPAENLLRFRGGSHDQRCAATLYRDEDRKAVRRYAWPERSGFWLLSAPELRADASPQKHLCPAPLSSKDRRTGGLSPSPADSLTPDQLGSHYRAV